MWVEMGKWVSFHCVYELSTKGGGGWGGCKRERKGTCLFHNGASGLASCAMRVCVFIHLLQLLLFGGTNKQSRSSPFRTRTLADSRLGFFFSVLGVVSPQQVSGEDGESFCLVRLCSYSSSSSKFFDACAIRPSGLAAPTIARLESGTKLAEVCNVHSNLHPSRPRSRVHM